MIIIFKQLIMKNQEKGNLNYLKQIREQTKNYLEREIMAIAFIFIALGLSAKKLIINKKNN